MRALAVIPIAAITTAAIIAVAIILRAKVSTAAFATAARIVIVTRIVTQTPPCACAIVLLNIINRCQRHIFRRHSKPVRPKKLVRKTKRKRVGWRKGSAEP